jgi:hypothetical protein
LPNELGHIRADHETRFLDRYHGPPACGGVAGVAAESTAYVVTTSAGMSTDAYSVPYLAGWSDGNAELLRDTAARVLDTARAITTDLTLDSQQGPEVPGAGTVGMPRSPFPVLETRSLEPPNMCA